MRQKENAEKRSRGVLIFIIVAVSLSAGAEAPGVREHRVSAWSAAMHAPLPFPGVPLPVFENQTIRRHPSATGYKAMANTVDLTMLRRAPTSSTKK
jgi:hypothetical protein